MAMLPAKRCARALAVGLALVGATLLGPDLLGGSAGSASASALIGVLALDAPPPPPDPVPIIDKPVNPGADNNEAPQMRPRRHRGDPVMGR